MQDWWSFKSYQKTFYRYLCAIISYISISCLRHSELEVVLFYAYPYPQFNSTNQPSLTTTLLLALLSSPSLVQHECIPQALLGMDIICQAKSGMGKTAVFVLTTLHQIAPVDGEVHVLVLTHTRELAYQIQREYERFSKYLQDVKTCVFYGGMLIKKGYWVCVCC